MKQWVRARADELTRWLFSIKRWMYRGGRPALLARIMNRASEIQFSSGLLAPKNAVTLEVRGRKSGRVISFLVVLVGYQGDRYLVSMLGDNANWVRNVRAAGGHAVVRRRGRTSVQLDEVDPAARAPILRRYLDVAGGASAHPGGSARPAGRLRAGVAAQYPVFRMTTAD